jgi:hypothetical protein
MNLILFIIVPDRDSSNSSIPSAPPSKITPPYSSAPVSDTPQNVSPSNGVVGTPQDRRKEQIGVEIKDLKELCSHCFMTEERGRTFEHILR